MRRRVAAVVTAVLATGCSERSTERSEPQAVAQGDAGADGDRRDAAPSLAIAPLERPAGADGKPVSEPAALEAMGAIPVWEAVVERHRLLARRGQRGAAFGVIGGSVEGDDALYLIDDTEGEGHLGARLQLPPSTALEPGQRVVVWGAWVAKSGHWAWRADRIGLLEPGEAPAAPPRLHPDPARSLAAGAVPVSRAEKGRWAELVIRERPLETGDGWDVSDPGSDEVVALLLLPGERGAYGGQDMRADGERWRLSRGGRYQVMVRRVYHFKHDDRVPVVYAQGAPAGVIVTE